MLRLGAGEGAGAGDQLLLRPADPQALLRSDVQDLRKSVSHMKWRLTCMVDDVENIDHGLCKIERGLGLLAAFQ